ncbi:MAG: phosphatidylserine decarboxylase [Rhodospirillales bacterium]|nr:phosphatidylserine decarboxylase [Rhodospirillales bacterium]MBO6786092.1 phosphatidylserine decarboxylase [Rhodospirillales bacterium]
MKIVLVPINKAGYPFIAIFAIAALFLYAWWEPAGVVGGLLTAWCVYFFRDPDRITPTGDDLVICPADGVVQSVIKAPPPPELDMGSEPMTRVAVFMNVFNVHVNRSPISGIVSAKHYRPGRFFNASLDKASEFNERMSLKVKNDDGTEIAFVQIAGLVARRILCYVDVGAPLQAGERFGLIRFGSRVDIYLPDGVQPLVIEGQTTIAGETVIADLKRSGEPLKGEVR